MSTNIIIDAVNITKQYGDFKALDDLSLQVERGGVWALLGPNGAGKTTFLKCLLGLKEFSGEIEIDGYNIQKDPKKAKYQIGYVPQHPSLYNEMSVQESLRYFGDMRDVKRSRLRELLEFVGLELWARQPVGALSGGMQQRVALARCLINDPELILMDEPLGALDALTREKMQSLILKIWKETGKTIMIITHSVEEALMLGERLFVMAPRPGRLHKEYSLPFAELGLKQDPREIKKNQEFVAKREEILAMIWDMEEEIMGQVN